MASAIARISSEPRIKLRRFHFLRNGMTAKPIKSTEYIHQQYIFQSDFEDGFVSQTGEMICIYAAGFIF